MPTKTHKPLVLVVEDQFDLREITAEIVAEFGFQVVTAENGRQALTLLNDMVEPPSLILLDLMMPVMTGWQLIAELQQSVKLRNIPFVVMSAVAEELDSSLHPVARLKKPDIYCGLIEILQRLRNDQALGQDDAQSDRTKRIPMKAPHQAERA